MSLFKYCNCYSACFLVLISDTFSAQDAIQRHDLIGPLTD